MKIEVGNLEGTQALAKKLAQNLELGSVIELVGNLGAGKTTFTQALGKALGVSRPIKSPTYSIVKEYPIPGGLFVHIDAYRLEEGGADTIDLDSYLNQNAILVVEWAQFIEEYLPDDRLVVEFQTSDHWDQRTIIISQKGRSNVDLRKLCEGKEEDQ